MDKETGGEVGVIKLMFHKSLKMLDLINNTCSYSFLSVHFLIFNLQGNHQKVLVIQIDSGSVTA